MKVTGILPCVVIFFLLISSCAEKRDSDLSDKQELSRISTKENTPSGIVIEKDFLYHDYLLEDIYPYEDTIRFFQWSKIRNYLTFVDSIQEKPALWGILQNRDNKNGESPLVKIFYRNAYKRNADTFGVERYQGIPLYLANDTLVPERYGLDGALVKRTKDTSAVLEISTIFFDGNWRVPKRYVKFVNDTVIFRKVIFVDRTNQNIATFEKMGKKWLVRSMNPATTGRHKPPRMMETPLGIFVLQEKKERMVYLNERSTRKAGFAPYANRFCNGGYIHGIPVDLPHRKIIEISPSLGTIPRSHMCVRVASSHAKFIFDWAPIEESLVVVFD